MSTRTRAYRRHHRQRMIARAIRKYLDWDYRDKDWIEWSALRNHSHMCTCSCWMCGNDRRNPWLKTKERLTIQERKVYNSLREGLEDFHDQTEEEIYYGNVQPIEGQEVEGA